MVVTSSNLNRFSKFIVSLLIFCKYEKKFKVVSFIRCDNFEVSIRRCAPAPLGPNISTFAIGVNARE